MTDSDDHLPDPHEDQHVAHLSPWVAEQFLGLLARYGQAMYVAGRRSATLTEAARIDCEAAHRTASTQLKQLLGVENPDHE